VVSDSLPLTETIAPCDQNGISGAVRAAFEAGSPVYPIGGGTSLDFGLAARRPGIGISLAGLNRVVDYPARDMTITVEAGITMKQLANTLATERQWLPVDAPQPEQATMGGVVACAASGPRRFGSGTMRDYVIGISAVDGRGMAFKGGGRVVKNVAGYDFCKLLTGSLGTLGVITQVTLKIRPLPEKSALIACDVPDLALLDRLLGALITSNATPSAIEFVAGPAWSSNGRLIVGLEGTEGEVNWMCRALADEWRALGVATSEIIKDEAAKSLWQQLRDFPTDRNSPLVLKATLKPSAVCSFVALARQIDPKASIQAHAGTGIVIVRFAEISVGDLSRQLIGRLQPATRIVGGECVVLSSNGLGELTRQAQWGGIEGATLWMTKVKRQFDPKDILNPGRSVYESL
jgi:glycolate oxidase FAD binding subunit